MVSNLVSAKTETAEILLRWYKTASNGLSTLIKVITNVYGVSNLVSAITETTEKLLRWYRMVSNE